MKWGQTKAKKIRIGKKKQEKKEPKEMTKILIIRLVLGNQQR